MKTATPEALTVAQVRHIASLARLQLDDDEAQGAIGDLQCVLHHMAMLSELNLTEACPSLHGVALPMQTRADEIWPSLGAEVALANAPDRVGVGFGVPKII